MGFEEAGDTVDFIGWDAGFGQGIAKVVDEAVEMAVVEAAGACLCVGGGDVFAGIGVLAAEDHGDEHSLACEKLRHVRSFEKGTKSIVGEDFFVERFDGEAESSRATKNVIEIVGHRFLLNRNNVMQGELRDEARAWG